jgi:beta propeller repeat protein
VVLLSAACGDQGTLAPAPTDEMTEPPPPAASTAASASLYSGPVVRITTDAADQTNPEIWGDLIVWQDERHGNLDIYAYDLRSGVEFQVTANPADQRSPDVWGDRIVWQDYRNGNWDIYLYDRNTGLESQLTFDPLDEDQPAIWEQLVVFARDPNPSPGGQDIVLYDLTTGSETVIREDWGTVPDIGQDWVAWADHGLRNAWAIVAFDLHSGQTTEVGAEYPAEKYEPAIAGNRVAWNTNFVPNVDVYLSDLASGQTLQITSAPEFQCCAAMDGDIVTWGDHRGDLYFHDLSTGLQHRVTYDDPAAINTSVSGHRIVWQGAGAGYDIYMVELAVPVEIDIKPGSDPNCFNADGHGVVPVAILTTDDFDASTVDPATVLLDGAGVSLRGRSNKLMAHEEDVDGDGDVDLVVQIEDMDNWFNSGQDGSATLTGETFDGQPIEGTDSICIVPRT